mgnify:CR=1 FL=1
MTRERMVRKATKADIPRIAEIIIFGKRVAYRPIFQDDRASFNEFLVVPLAEEYQRDISLLENMFVYDDGIIKGVVNANPVTADEAEISEFYVEPFFKGQGIGRALLEEVIAQAKLEGRKRISLWVLEENKSARKFYEANGFVHTGKTDIVGDTGKVDLCYEQYFEKYEKYENDIER